jgi:hypothetical protein
MPVRCTGRRKKLLSRLYEVEPHDEEKKTHLFSYLVSVKSFEVVEHQVLLVMLSLHFCQNNTSRKRVTTLVGLAGKAKMHVRQNK